MLNKIRKSARRGDDGASAVEYGLLVAAIAAIIVVVVFALGTLVNKTFNDTCTTIKGQGTATAASC
jgi:pilus assembly protein Flp/PilA